MVIILSIPLGILCLILAGLCLRVGKMPHALTCALTGVFFLGLAAVMTYATNVLVQEMSRTN